MFDDVNIALDPPDAYAYAGYVDGRYANFDALKRAFPKAKHLSITVFGDRADCYDIEPGDGTNADVYAWFVAMQAADVWRPCVYTSADNLVAMQSTMAANGFARDSYRLWSAHYTGVPHFCGPKTCGYGLSQVDATQFTSRALGRSLDESLVADDFFPTNFAENPVKNLHVSHGGYTSLTFAWDADANATGYTAELYNVGGRLKRKVKVTTPSVRFRRLWPEHYYLAKVRAHPGNAQGSDATCQGVTH